MNNQTEQLIKVLSENNMTICTAESCTGGLLASMIVDVPGASDVFGRGFVTYANDAKHDLLGVTWEALDAYGAVSAQVAEQMAQGAAKEGAVRSLVVGVGITGIAGPDGGTAEKPVGLVYIGCHVQDRTFVEECHFEGERRAVRESAAKEAVRYVLDCIDQCILS